MKNHNVYLIDERDVLKMGLFDFLKKRPSAKNKSVSNLTTNLEDSTQQNVVETRSGVVSTNKVYLDASTHALLQNRFIAFDVETTELSASTDRIIELGAVLFENGIPTKAFSSLVNPGIAVPAAATAINHITNAMVKNAPDEEIVYPEFLEFLRDAVCGNTIMCAHNARFDFDFLGNTLSRLGFDAELKYIDTLALSRHYIPGLANYKQCTVESHLGLNNHSSHRAESDAEMCGKILCRILDIAKESVEEEKKHIEAAVPTQEELEICAFLLNDLMKRGADISWIRFRKNSSNYVDVVCLYTYLKFRFAKKGKYMIIAEKETIGTILPTEACTVSEGGTDFRRVFFNKPQDLIPFLDYFYRAYRDCYKSMRDYIALGNYARREAEECIRTMKALSENEISALLSSAASREYTDITSCVKIAPEITRADVIVNAVNNRCPLREIKNLNDWDKGFQAGFKFWEKGEVARKEGDLDTALSLYDKARYNGYDAPALYESYAMTYRQLKDYDNEIVILEEFLSRNTYGKSGAFEARRDKAIVLLYKKQQAEKLAIEKAMAKEKKKQEKSVKEKAPSTPQQPKGKPILQLADDGTVIHEFDTVTAASKAIGVSTKSIRDAAQGIQKHAGGYCWKYKD